MTIDRSPRAKSQARQRDEDDPASGHTAQLSNKSRRNRLGRSFALPAPRKPRFGRSLTLPGASPYQNWLQSDFYSCPFAVKSCSCSTCACADHSWCEKVGQMSRVFSQLARCSSLAIAPQSSSFSVSSVGATGRFEVQDFARARWPLPRFPAGKSLVAPF
jgi:hypothetical protein